MDGEDRAAFDSFARSRLPELMRFGYALTGSRGEAEDLVQDALERTGLAWRRVVNKVDPEGYVRRVMVNRHISIWRRMRRESVVESPPERGHVGRRTP